jgi:flagellar basal-body rod protein FlgG
MQALHAAKLGLIAQQDRVNVVANNIANVNTPGYKNQRVDFKDALYTQILDPAELKKQGLEQGTGVLMAATGCDLSQGTVLGTGEDLDMYIDGDGYFCVSDAGGAVTYTRSGAFAVSDEADGNWLVNANGHYVLDENMGRIRIPESTEQISVSEDGTLLADGVSLGRLGVVTFANRNGLESAGNAVYRETAASGAPETSGAVVRQGGLEASNVNIAVELTQLIRAQKAFAMASRAVSVWDEMAATTSNLRT